MNQIRNTRSSLLDLLLLTGIILGGVFSEGKSQVLWGRGPGLWELTYEFLEETADHQVLLGYSVPGGKGSIFERTYTRINTMGLHGGARFDSTGLADFRWRITLVDIDIRSSPIYLGGTIIDLRNSGYFERDNRWVMFRLGLSGPLGGRRLLLVPRILGTVGISSVEVAQRYYTNIPVSDSTEMQGLEIGYTAGATLLIGRVLILHAEIKHRNFLKYPEPSLETVTVQGGLNLGGKRVGITVFARFSLEETQLADFSATHRNRLYQAGINLLIRPPRPGPFEDFD